MIPEVSRSDGRTNGGRAMDPAWKLNWFLTFWLLFVSRQKVKDMNFGFITFPLMKSNQKSRQNNASSLQAFTRPRYFVRPLRAYITILTA